MFPPIEKADENGLLAISYSINVPILVEAYKNGIFPWPVEEDFIPWFCPPKRAVLFFNEFKISGSLARLIKKNNYTLKINANFKNTIKNCSKIRKNQSGTWITKQIIDAYNSLHLAGYCHSIECYDQNLLIGGLYGVSINAMFAGESMFYLRSNASKLCLCYLVSYLKEQGLSWIDCQQLTPFLKNFGAREIKRDEFISLLKNALSKNIELFSMPICSL